MPYKDRETYLRKQREFYARRKARAQSHRVSTKILLTPATAYAQKTSQGAKSTPRASSKGGPIQPVSGVSRASVPPTPLTPGKQNKRGPVLARSRDPNKGNNILYTSTNLG